MPATIVVGGQYGSEGKGKVVALTSALLDRPHVVRCGGPNSGHTTSVNGVEQVLRQLPAAAGHNQAMLYVAAGCAVNEEILVRELDDCRITPARIVIDPRAVLVTDWDRENEAALMGEIGSTGSGTGSALIRRMGRTEDVQLVKDSRRLCERARVEDVAPLLHDALDGGEDVIVEGTQGFGLSLLHGPHYPYVTARDTTAAGFATEVGISPRQVDEIALVIRTFPIRVAGLSGPLPEEITWEQIQKMSGAPDVYPELTSVTRRVRRVGHFDIDLVRRACKYNRPTSVSIMGLDRLDYADNGKTDYSSLTSAAIAHIDHLSEELMLPIRWVGTGFSTFEAASLSRLEAVAN
jgi:adenylosuccinate synthase